MRGERRVRRRARGRRCVSGSRSWCGSERGAGSRSRCVCDGWSGRWPGRKGGSRTWGDRRRWQARPCRQRLGRRLGWSNDQQQYAYAIAGQCQQNGTHQQCIDPLPIARQGTEPIHNTLSTRPHHNHSPAPCSPLLCIAVIIAPFEHLVKHPIAAVGLGIINQEVITLETLGIFQETTRNAIPACYASIL